MNAPRMIPAALAGAVRATSSRSLCRAGLRGALGAAVVAALLAVVPSAAPAPAPRVSAGHAPTSIPRDLARPDLAGYGVPTLEPGAPEYGWFSTEDDGDLVPVDVASGELGAPFDVSDVLGAVDVFDPSLSPGGADLFFDVQYTDEPLYVLNTSTGLVTHVNGIAEDEYSSSYDDPVFPTVAFAPGSPDAYVVVPGSDDLYTVDLAHPADTPGSVALSESLEGSTSVAVSPDGRTLYALVEDEDGYGHVVTYLTSSGAEQSTFEVAPDFAYNGLAVDPVTGHVYVTQVESIGGGYYEGYLDAYSTTGTALWSDLLYNTHDQFRDYSAPLVDPATGLVGVTEYDDGFVYLATADDELTTVQIGNEPTGLAFSADGTVAAVPSQAGQVTVFSLQGSPEVTDTFSIGDYPGYGLALPLFAGPIGGPVPEPELWGGKDTLGPHECSCNSERADPVDVSEGDYHESAADAAVAGDGPALALVRTYDANAAQVELADDAPGPFGYGWTDDWAMQLLVGAPAAGDVTAQTEAGARTVFYAETDDACSYPWTVHGDFCATPHVVGSLTASGSDYVLTEDDGTTAGFTASGSTGVLQWVKGPLGHEVSLSYGGEPPGGGGDDECPGTASSCETLTGDGGRSLTLGWSEADESGDVTSVTGQDGGTTTYGYCTSESPGYGSTCRTGDLVSVTGPAGGVTHYYYSSTAASSPVDLQEDLVGVQPPATSGSLSADDVSGFCDDPVSDEAPAGSTVTCYGAAGHVTAQASPDAAVTTFDDAGMDFSDGDGSVAVTGPDGSTTVYDYAEGELVGTAAAAYGSGGALAWDGTSWSARSAADAPSGLTAVSCPTASFCAGTDGAGDVVTWDGSTWSAPARVDGTALGALSCASATFCAATDDAGQLVTWDGTAWAAPADIDGATALAGISCPSSSFCAAVDAAGDALTSADPAGGPSDWTSADADGSQPLDAVSCASSSSCTAVDSWGSAVGWDGTDWGAPDDADGEYALEAVSCPTTSFCAAVDSFGNALTFDGSTWSAPDDVDGTTRLASVSCASATACVAVDRTGDALVYDGTSWSAASDVDGAVPLTGVSCASGSSCTAVDEEASPSVAGYAYDPASLGTTESVAPDGSVTTASYDASGNAVTATDATGGTTEAAYNSDGQAWCSVSADEQADGVTCPDISPPTSVPETSYPGTTIDVYNGSDELTATIGPLGGTTTYAYTSDDEDVPDGLAYCEVAPVAYAADVSCAAYGDHEDGTTSWTYDASGDVASVTGPTGGATEYTYYGNGQPGTETSPDGTLTTDHYTDGELTSQVVSSGDYSATTLYAYDGAGQLICQVAPAEYADDVTTCPSSPPTPPTPGSDSWPGRTITTYDADGNVTQVTSPLGGITYTAYDPDGRAYCTVGPTVAALDGDLCSGVAPGAQPAAGSDDADLGATVTTYDPEGRVVQATGPTGGATVTTYAGGSDDPATTTVESGDDGAPDVVTAYAYDPDGRVVSTTVGTGDGAATTAQAYDPDGSVYCSVSADNDADGAYGGDDTSGWQCPPWQAGWISAPPSPSTLYSSTPGSSQAKDVTTTFSDAAGDEIQSTDPDVQTTVTAYDLDGRAYCSAGPVDVATWLTAHDDGAYPYLCPSGPPGSAPTGTAEGYVTTLHDAAGETLSTTDPEGDTTSYTYAPGGQVLTTADPRSEVTTDCWYYESSVDECAHAAPSGGGSDDDLWSATTPGTSADPDGEVTTSTYFPGGAADETTTPAGTTTDGWDAAGDLTSVDYSSTADGYTAPADVSYTYDLDGSRASMSDGTGTTDYTYDDAGNLLAQDFAPASGSGLSSEDYAYTYYPSGQLATVAYPAYAGYDDGGSAPVATYVYDDQGDMASVSDWEDDEVAFSTDGDGDLTAQDDKVSGSEVGGTASAYDPADEPTGAQTALSCAGSSATTLTQAFSASYSPPSGTTTAAGSTDANGDVTQDEEVYADDGDATACSGLASYERDYSYDEDGRVVWQDAAAQGDSANDFSYDDAGDPTEISSHDGSGSFDTYTEGSDDAGEATSQTPVEGSDGSSSTFTYDTLGDQVTAGSTTDVASTYDQAGRLAAESTGSVTGSTDAYDGDGLLTAQSGWSPVDDVDGSRTIFSISCPTASFCAAGDDAGDLLTWDGSSWTTDHADSTHTIEGTSCTSATSCTAVDNDGGLFTWDGSWSSRDDVDTTVVMGSVSCTSSSDCTAVDDSGDVLVTTDGWSGHTRTNVDPHMIDRVSCASSSDCTAVDDDGRVVSTTNGWSSHSGPTDIDGTVHVGSVSCPTTSFCAAVDNDGNAITTTDDFSSSNTTTDIDGSTEIESVDCVSTSFCVATDVDGNAMAYNGTTWSPPEAVDPTTLRGPSCASGTFCVAVDHDGGVLGWDGAPVAQLTWSPVVASLPSVVSDGSWDYVYGPQGEPVEQVNTTTSPPADDPQFLAYEPADSSWLSTSTTGEEIAFWRYDAFGTLALGTPGSAFGYGGQYAGLAADQNGLEDLRARWYSPQTGGFTTRDPMFAETDQAYAYAGGDPVNGGDPSGRCPGEWYCGALSLGSDAGEVFVDEAAGAANGLAKLASSTVNNVAGVACNFFTSAYQICPQLQSAWSAVVPAVQWGVGIPDECGGALGDVEAAGYALGTGVGYVAPGIFARVPGDAAVAAEGGAGSGFEIVGSGTVTRTIDFTPDAADPNWGLTGAHLDKHLFGSGSLSLSMIDPGATSDSWVAYIQELAGQPATATLKGGIEDIIGTFPKASGAGTFQFGIRIAPNGDGTYSLITLLTKQ